MSVNEKEGNEINPKGKLTGSSKQQQWQILNWHEIRLAQMKTLLVDYDKNMKTLATEILDLKTEISSLKKMKN